MKNENKTEEMVQILDILHKHVPSKTTTQEFEVVEEESTVTLQLNHFAHIQAGGDQLSVARIHGCQKVRSNAECGTECLEGLVPVVEDWHTKMCFMKVSYHNF